MGFDDDGDEKPQFVAMQFPSPSIGSASQATSYAPANAYTSPLGSSPAPNYQPLQPRNAATPMSSAAPPGDPRPLPPGWVSAFDDVRQLLLLRPLSLNGVIALLYAVLRI